MNREELRATLPPGRRGLAPLRQAEIAYKRRTSPRGRAGRIGGIMSQRNFPASERPRDSQGRFAAKGTK